MRYINIISLCLFMILAWGCGPQVQILLIKDSPISAKHNPTLERVKSAIMTGGELANWQMHEVKPGHISATIRYDDLMAKVDILYTVDSYDIIYKESENMNYEDNLIHPRYNRWVIRLDKSIRRTILRGS